MGSEGVGAEAPPTKAVPAMLGFLASS
ncbi:hypothetical protein [Lysobacter capsici]